MLYLFYRICVYSSLYITFNESHCKITSLRWFDYTWCSKYNYIYFHLDKTQYKNILLLQNKRAMDTIVLKIITFDWDWNWKINLAFDLTIIRFRAEWANVWSCSSLQPRNTITRRNTISHRRSPSHRIPGSPWTNRQTTLSP